MTLMILSLIVTIFSKYHQLIVTHNDNSLRDTTLIFVYNLDEPQFSGGYVTLLKGKCEGRQGSSVRFQNSTWRPVMIESVAVFSASLSKRPNCTSN